MFEELSDAELIARTAALDNAEMLEQVECCDCHTMYTPNSTRGQRRKRCPQCAHDYIMSNGCKKDAKVIGVTQGRLCLRRIP